MDSIAMTRGTYIMMAIASSCLREVLGLHNDHFVSSINASKAFSKIISTSTLSLNLQGLKIMIVESSPSNITY